MKKNFERRREILNRKERANETRKRTRKTERDRGRE